MGWESRLPLKYSRVPIELYVQIDSSMLPIELYVQVDSNCNRSSYMCRSTAAATDQVICAGRQQLQPNELYVQVDSSCNRSSYMCRSTAAATHRVICAGRQQLQPIGLYVQVDSSCNRYASYATDKELYLQVDSRRPPIKNYMLYSDSFREDS